MNFRKRILLALVIGAALLVAACGSPASSSSDTSSNNAQAPTSNAPAAAPTQAATSLPASPQAEQAAQAAGQPVNENGEPIVARVNDAVITRAEFERAVARYQMQQLTFADDSAMQATVLDTLIDQALIEQAAAAENIQVTDAEVQAELDANIEIAGGEQAWQQWLDANMFTADEFRETLYNTLLTARMRDSVTQDVNANVPQVHARHILVETESEATSLLEQLNAGGDFAALAAQHSRDVTTREQGGDLGWFAQDELLEPYLAQVAFSLDPGAIAGPVPTSLGFHVVQVIERGDRPIPEEKRASVAQNQFENWLADLRRNATIERYL